MYLPQEKILFASEAYSNHIFPNMRAAVPAEWIQTVKALRAIDANTVIPGHGAIEDGPAMKASLAAFEQSLEYIVAEATRLHKVRSDGRRRDKASQLGSGTRHGPPAIGTQRSPFSGLTTPSTEN